MSARINLESERNGLRALELENDALLVSVLPQVGAKIYDLIAKRAGQNFLWHNPRILPQTYPVDANFDNYWCGGWDEGFPTCDACMFQGEQYPNLGELRSVVWQVSDTRSDDEGASVTLSAYGPISPVKAEKQVTLASSGPIVRVRSRITNLGPAPLEFIWGTHPALNVSDEAILRIPARTGIVGQVSHASLGQPGQCYVWPHLETRNGKTDMSRTLPASSGLNCGHYATDLEGGWYAVEDAATGRGFLLKFSVETCPYLWMWLSYGGWRGYHHVIVEPWTSYPVNLADAVQKGTARRLAAGETFESEVSATVYGPPETWQDARKRLENRP